MRPPLGKAPFLLQSFLGPEFSEMEYRPVVGGTEIDCATHLRRTKIILRSRFRTRLKMPKGCLFLFSDAVWSVGNELYYCRRAFTSSAQIRDVSCRLNGRRDDPCGVFVVGVCVIQCVCVYSVVASPQLTMLSRTESNRLCDLGLQKRVSEL